MSEPRWRVECKAKQGGSFAIGRDTRVFFDGVELKSLTRVAIDLPVDGIARITLTVLPADIDIVTDAIATVVAHKDRADGEVAS